MIALGDNLKPVPISQPNHIEELMKVEDQRQLKVKEKQIRNSRSPVIGPHRSAAFIDPYRLTVCKFFHLTQTFSAIFCVTFDPGWL